MTVSANTDLLATRIGQEVKALRTLINANAADLTALNTVEKSNLVGALNEVLTAAGSATINDAGTTASDIWSAAKIISNTTSAIDGLINGAPGTLDTIGEISTALQNNPDVIQNLLTQQAANTTSITAAQTDATQALADAAAASTAAGTASTAASTASTAAAAAQSTADGNTTSIAALTADVGSPTTDYIATFNAALV